MAKLIVLANTSWPKPFECYTLIDSQDRYVGTIGRNHKIESEFSIQLFDVEEANSSWATVKRPQPIYVDSFATVDECVAAAASFLAD